MNSTRDKIMKNSNGIQMKKKKKKKKNYENDYICIEY